MTSTKHLYLLPLPLQGLSLFGDGSEDSVEWWEEKRGGRGVWGWGCGGGAGGEEGGGEERVMGGLICREQ